MKTIALTMFALAAASVISSCCCQSQPMPPLKPMPHFTDIGDNSGDRPVILETKGKK